MAMMIVNTIRQGDTMSQKFLLKAVTAGVALALAGCGGGDSVSTSGATTRSYTLPTEISAVPAATSTAASLRGASLLGRLDRAAADLGSSSDYNKAATSKYVEEHALEQFSIIEQVMSALSQTHYNDAANQDGVAYKAMVAWEDDNNGVSVKQLQPWVIKSELVTGLHPDGSTAEFNKVQAWIEEEDEDNPGQKKVIRAEFKIYSGATFASDGTVLSYGDWDLNVAFGSNSSKFFVASSRNNNGTPVLKINEDEGENFSRAVLYRSGSSGYGKVEYPDHSNCQSWPCAPAIATASYAYNDAYLVVDDGSGPVYKDRSSEVEMTHRYGLFYANADAATGVAAGDNVQKHKSFGFPVTYVDGSGAKQHAYYGAWQGRHQLWGGGQSGVPAGTLVTREDFAANTSPEQFTVSATVNGSFTKRTLVAGSPDDIKDIVVETFTNKHFELFKVNGAWMTCEGGWVDFNAALSSRCVSFQTNVGGPLVAFDKWGVLKGDGRKSVNIGRWDSVNQVALNYVYLAAADGVANFTTAGFYPATQGQNGLATTTGGNLYAGSNSDQLWVDIGGSIYIQYTGDFSSGKSGWVQKKLTSFDQQSWTPTFESAGDANFTPEQGREYYINSNGVNYAVRRIAANNVAADYEVQLELQSTVNPLNITSFLPTGTDHLGTPWRPEVKLMLDTNSANTTTFMKLVYKADDPSTNGDDTGLVYTSGEWGLQAFNASNQPLDIGGVAVVVDGFGVPTGASRPVQFNWEYSANGGWGTQQYLIDANSQYKLLSDPISLTAQSYAYSYQTGVSKTLALQFDGWLHGMPDLYKDLQKNDWTMSSALSQKVINIAAGTQVTDSNGVAYYIKPLQVSIFLAEVAQPTTGAPDVTLGSALDVGAGSALLPTFTDHGMTSVIPTATVRYSEGKAL